ncbi:MAG TPA: 3-hydroxyacyl-CoA dehydrogenase NAD-binding domain-containing protein [Bacillota bacterium]|nr:3-hydroxyacyl-CoA dehydrogenase NAD-binding domain-containing protein [Bacillota bacterium]
MSFNIKKAVVLGSGIMGSGIAAHLANVGIETLMLDLIPKELTDEEKQKGLTLEDAVVCNRIAAQNKQALLKQNPSPLTTKKNLDLITVGNFEDDMDKVAEADWVIEVVVENLDIKKQVYSQVDEHYKEGTIVSSNTSGISVEAMIEDCSEELKNHFLGTHFFNPPRYLKLLEIIPTKDTLPEVLEFMKAFGENVLGKGVVEAKDTPNFIGNRIGTYGLLITVEEMLSSGLKVGEIDSITGTLIGRPRSATFRTLDLVGLDTFAHVANNVYEQVTGEEKEVFKIPDFMEKMLENKWFGEKTRKGFYERVRGEDGSIIYEIDPETFEFSKQSKLETPAVQQAKQQRGSLNRLKALVYAKEDKAGDFLWTVMKRTFLYAAELVGEISDDIVAIDQAMKWGFGWEYGPFESWDGIGVAESVERMKEEGETIPEWIEKMLEEGHTSFYTDKDFVDYYFDHESLKYEKVETNERDIDLQKQKDVHGVVKKNAGASLIDLGDDVLGLEFHSQSNAIGLDIIQLINQAIDEVETKDYRGLVIGNEGRNFCVGANLGLMLMEAQDFNFFELELVVRQFQNMAMNIKYAEKPVVVAPFQMTLGGGAEVSLPGAAVQAQMETYMGLVEFGVGLIPGGGGTKELYLKILRNFADEVDVDLHKVANHVFETIAMAKVSTSAEEAKELGFLDNNDRISVHPDHLLYDAKQRVIELSEAGYQAPKREKIPVVGDAGYGAMLLGAKSLQFGGYASEHDVKIAEKLAYVLSGGRIREGTEIDEQVMLDLEREAFLSLIGEPLTQQRMQHMLVKGKPLRN